MPFKCSVFGCNSNYDFEKSKGNKGVSCYEFPDELTDNARYKVWKKKLWRKNCVVTGCSRVCLKHFEERFIIRTFEFVDRDRIHRSEPRERPKLTDDAIPTLFDNLPSYLSTPLPPVRTQPDARRAAIDQRDDAQLQEFLDGDVIGGYNEFLTDMKARCEAFTSWTIHEKTDCTYIFLTDDSSGQLSIAVSIKVCADMCVRVHVGTVELHAGDLSWILNDSCTLLRWSQLYNILSHYGSSLTDGGYDTEANECNTVVSSCVAKVCNLLAVLCTDEFADTCKSSLY